MQPYKWPNVTRSPHQKVLWFLSQRSINLNQPSSPKKPPRPTKKEEVEEIPPQKDYKIRASQKLITIFHTKTMMEEEVEEIPPQKDYKIRASQKLITIFHTKTIITSPWSRMWYIVTKLKHKDFTFNSFLLSLSKDLYMHTSQRKKIKENNNDIKILSCAFFFFFFNFIGNKFHRYMKFTK